MTEWQPIETAPHYKKVLIAFYWKENSEFYDKNEPWDIECGWYTGDRYIEGGAYLDLNDMQAKWLPLPEPPKENE